MIDQSNYYRSYIDSIISLFLKRDFDRVKREIEETLAESPSREGMDNDFIEYISLNVLGLVKFEEGNVSYAEKLLLDSSSISSPVITSFGHNLLLAHKLLCVDRKDTVKEYLLKIEQNSTPFFPSFTPYKWRQALQNGETPDFGKHRFMHFLTKDNMLNHLIDYASCSD